MIIWDAYNTCTYNNIIILESPSSTIHIVRYRISGDAPMYNLYSIVYNIIRQYTSSAYNTQLHSGAASDIHTSLLQ